MEGVIVSLYLLVTAVAYTVCYEYGSFHNSQPPFHYFRKHFVCAAHNETIKWDVITIEIHPKDSDCGVTLLRHELPALWDSLGSCLNEGRLETKDCSVNPEEGLVYQMDTDWLMDHRDIMYPCRNGTERPEILAMHIIYQCEGRIHNPDIDGDIMTNGDGLPPVRPRQERPPPPPRVDPTMAVGPEHHEPVTEHHNVVSRRPITTPKTSPPVETPNVSQSHSITSNELAMIVGPSVGALCLLLIIGIVVIVLVKRNHLKLPGDLQGESLFNSRRFSTASQISDISINNINTQPFR